jgi:hypothetical protein
MKALDVPVDFCGYQICPIEIRKIEALAWVGMTEKTARIQAA